MEKQVEQLYNQWHNALPVDVDIDTPWHNFVRKKLDVTSDLTSKRILEIGCGRGGFAIYLSSIAAAGTEIVAADFSKAAVDKGKEYALENNISNITWHQADIQKLPFPDNYFDTVISCETIEHVPDPLEGVRELSRVLRPGGKLIVTTPNYLGIFGLYRGYLRLTGRKWTEKGQPINNFTMVPCTLRWLKKSGIKVIFFDSEIISMPFPGKSKVKYFNFRRPRWFWKWFGLQSYFEGTK